MSAGSTGRDVCTEEVMLGLRVCLEETEVSGLLTIRAPWPALWLSDPTSCLPVKDQSVYAHIICVSQGTYHHSMRVRSPDGLPGFPEPQSLV